MNKYSELIDNLVTENKSKRNEEAEFTLSRARYAKEFCTVKVDIGRGVGKSTYIFENARTNKNLVICSYRFLFERIMKTDVFYEKPVCVIYKEEDPRSFIRKIYPFDFDTIYVDDYSVFSRSGRGDDVLNAIVSMQDSNPTLILLG